MKIKKLFSIITITVLMLAINIAPVLAAQNTQNTNNTTPSVTPVTNTSAQTTTSTVPRKITKTYTFKTDKKPFTYDPPKTITEGEYKYEYKSGITYKENSSTQPVKETKTFTNLTSRTVPNSITSNGKTLYLSGSPSYTAHTTPAKKTTQTVTDTRTYNNVIPGTESSVIKDTIEKSNVTLKKSRQTYTTGIENFSESGRLASYDHDMNVSGTSIQLSDSTPQQGNWKEDLRQYFELPSSTSIHSASWGSDIQHSSGSNKYTRTVNYSGARTVYNYTVSYSGTKTVVSEPEKTTYTATATYQSRDKTEYNVTATVPYEMTAESVAVVEAKEKEAREQQEQLQQEEQEEQEKIEQEEQEKEEEEARQAEEKRQAERDAQLRKRNILIGSSIGLLALLALGIALIATRGKKQKPQEDDLDKLFNQASSIKNNKNTAKKENEKQRDAEQKKEQARKEKEEKARKAAEEKERRRIEKQKAYEKKKAENQKRKNSAEKKRLHEKTGSNKTRYIHRRRY